jgi:DNA-binding GntR family transcriptional regulator
MTSVRPIDAEPVTVEALYAQLRHRILVGELRPGAALSQVKLADAFGTGRTPLREALRMLQREGLVDAEYNRRVRVSALSTSELDEIYARRVVLEAMAIRASVPRFSAVDLDRLAELRAEMEAFMPDPSASLKEWEVPHREFHRLLVRHAGRSIVRDCDQLQDHAERYRAILGSALPSSFAPGAADHAELVECCRRRDAHTAGQTLARHLARAGLALLSQTDPTHDAMPLREALKLVLHERPVEG